MLSLLEHREGKEGKQLFELYGIQAYKSMGSQKEDKRGARRRVTYDWAWGRKQEVGVHGVTHLKCCNAGLQGQTHSALSCNL
jgi:hypothetical protein